MRYNSSRTKYRKHALKQFWEKVLKTCVTAALGQSTENMCYNSFRTKYRKHVR